MRLIDADALIERLDEVYQDTSLYNEWRWFLTICEQEVENAPTIDPVKHGRWIRWVQNKDEWPAAMCSECQEKVDADNEGQYTNYCPNCGARMDGGAEDDG